ncbi:hypothetical protein RRSWK_01199 [Rhodopirellula sp. SWK7]|nr:hypothetical protein RRSWK_01199 [Rhodopirellula sp. SWK7]
MPDHNRASAPPVAARHHTVTPVQRLDSIENLPDPTACPCSTDVLDLLTGRTVITGATVPSYYCFSREFRFPTCTQRLFGDCVLAFLRTNSFFPARPMDR